MVNVRVNGQERAFDGDPSMPLMWYLRDELGLTGTKFGCGASLCGACTVHLDGERSASCAIAMWRCRGQGGRSRSRASIPTATIRCRRLGASSNVPQCGYCQAGQIMQAAALLQQKPNPTDERDRRRDVGQHLPLRLLSAHPRRRSRRRDGGVT